MKRQSQNCDNLIVIADVLIQLANMLLTQNVSIEVTNLVSIKFLLKTYTLSDFSSRLQPILLLTTFNESTNVVGCQCNHLTNFACLVVSTLCIWF